MQKKDIEKIVLIRKTFNFIRRRLEQIIFDARKKTFNFQTNSIQYGMRM